MATTAVALYGALVPVLYALLLLASRSHHALHAHAHAHAHGRRTHAGELRHALSFLHEEYRPEAYYWELCISVLKLLLTGVLALYSRGSLEQIFTALLLALVFMAVQLWTRPYKDESNALLSAISSTALVLVFMTSLLLQAGRFAEITSALPSLAVLLIASALALLLAFLLQFWLLAQAELRRPVAHWRTDRTIASPVRLDSCCYHAFISHSWGTGQDQSRSIKEGLASLAPGLACFLDVDGESARAWGAAA